ncbi:hypothetical protein [Enterococcus sp. LJL51]|uniref:hypothetical protein n=1 Tax=Enterococcus sp. LJL51 TaxID=3416656 RepID=UPI003CFA81F2
MKPSSLAIVAGILLAQGGIHLLPRLFSLIQLSDLLVILFNLLLFYVIISALKPFKTATKK